MSRRIAWAGPGVPRCHIPPQRLYGAQWPCGQRSCTLSWPVYAAGLKSRLHPRASGAAFLPAGLTEEGCITCNRTYSRLNLQTLRGILHWFSHHLPASAPCGRVIRFFSNWCTWCTATSMPKTSKPATRNLQRQPQEQQRAALSAVSNCHTGCTAAAAGAGEPASWIANALQRGRCVAHCRCL